MSAETDIAVLGAGPAGGAAALAAAAGGARVVLIDEQAHPGGQVWRKKDVDLPGLAETPETCAGARLRGDLEASGATFLGGTRLWHIERVEGGWRLHLLTRGDRAETLTARAAILAPGAREFVQPFAGWTTPGVYGLAGATALMKSQGCPPGRRSVVAGGGPLALFAAAEILRLGGEVAAVATPNGRGDWLRCAPILAANPALARRGAELIARIRRAGVPILWRHVVTRAEGDRALIRVHAAPCGAEWAPTGAARAFDADALCVGHGLIPNVDVAVLAGLPRVYDADRGGWVVEAGPDGRTALEGLFLCGDGAALRGAETAARAGAGTGQAALADLRGTPAPPPAPRRPDLRARFGRAMTALARPRPGLLRLTRPNTVVCRCESLTRATLDAAIDAGAAGLDALKSATRCGMGPCGGRYCLTAAARLIEDRTGAAEGTVPPPVPRPPLFPLPVAAVAAGFDYDDLPIPAPAPL
ncbi:FAD-dependent oxidoreductase [Rhodobacteraceae bacterium CCMM004]|nr:FAD-dependent oxidoreductase [Rhodobacteraceae bacterium CCMM004]